MDGIKLTKKLYTIDSARELGGNIKGKLINKLFMTQ